MVLLTDFDNGVCTLTLNRPEVRNAFNAELISSLIDAVSDINERDDVRVVVLRGNGKHFSAGADLNWMRDMKQQPMETNVDDARQLATLMYSLYQCRKPVIAVVHGAVMGGGVGLTACADIAIAQSEAFFALSETRLGLTPATISPFVVQAMGARQARRYMLTGERFSADKAQQLGLIHEVVSDESLEEQLKQVMEALLSGGPQSHRKIKKLVHDVHTRELDDELMENLAWRIANQRVGDEAQEGLSAFLEKRDPNWRGDSE